MALSQHLQQREFDSMHECPRSSYVRECSASASANRRRPVDRRRLAVLVSGHTRTMGTMDVVATYQQMFLMAAQEFAGGVHVFAYLDGGRTPTTAALKMFAAVPTTVLWHDESTLWGLLNGLQNGSTCDRRVCARTSTLPSLIQQRLNHPYTDQYAKVAATTEMMRRAEQLTGMKFDVVLRVRPDLCLGARSHEDIRNGLCTHAPLLAHATRLERRACHLPALGGGAFHDDLAPRSRAVRLRQRQLTRQTLGSS